MGIGKPLYLHIMSVYVRTVFEYFCYWHVVFFAGTDTFHVVVPRMWPTPNWNSSFGALAPSLTCISCERQMENHEEWVMSPIRSMSDIFVGRNLPFLSFFWNFGQRRMTIRWMPLANMYLSVGKCPGLGHHLQMVASENRQRWNSAVNVPEWQVLIFISWTPIFLYYSLYMLRLYVFHWLFAPAIEHSLELPCFYWVTYLSHVPHVPWSSHMADFPKGMVMMRPRTPELAALAIQQLLDRDVGGRPILVKDRGFVHGGFPVN